MAGYLLDCNGEDRLIQSGATAEYQANLQRNLNDAIAMLPKLCTGVDVNVKFHDIRAFEFTEEVAVFDLLDLSLVHGWLVDPQVRFAIAQHQHQQNLPAASSLATSPSLASFGAAPELLSLSPQGLATSAAQHDL